MIKRKMMYFLATAAMVGVVGLASQSFAAHPDVTLLDVGGNPAAGTTPYSPKISCSGCHIDCDTGNPATDSTQYCLDAAERDAAAVAFGDRLDYESDWALAAKTQFNRLGVKISYDVPYPEHGVSAGYHFQQGRNIDWDDTQRNAYNLPNFTSSAGMYGKY